MRIRSDCSNASLILHKGFQFAYAANLNQDQNKDGFEKSKAPFWTWMLEKFGDTNSPLAVPGYPEFFEEMKAARGEGRPFTFDQRVVVGLGVNIPAERGISLHPLFGVPVFPATGIKGIMLREAIYQFELEDLIPDQTEPFAWASLSDDPDIQQKLWAMQALFGDIDGVGRLKIYDALWVPGQSGFLRRNIDTQHNKGYYKFLNEGGKAKVPDDTEGPNPIQSVTLARGICMNFWLDAGDETWTNYAYDLLERALGRIGIGAKTSSGYGRIHVELPPPEQPVVDGVIEYVDRRSVTVRVGAGRAVMLNGAPNDLRKGDVVKVKKTANRPTYDFVERA